MRCPEPQCAGEIIEGFCDTCGRSAPNPTSPNQPARTQAASVPASGFSTGITAPLTERVTGRVTERVTGRVTGARRPSPRTATIGTAPGTSPGSSSRTGRRSSQSRGSSSRRRALGGGLVQMPIEPSLDPLQLLLTETRIPESKAVCPACSHRVNPDKRFCANCGAEYNFRPSLKAGDVLAGQYEVKGPIAFGGLGWIYLAMDTRLNRWVVLKGLLNTKDEAAAAAAVAERQFLAAVKHGKIVNIYTFLTEGSESFIVMEYVRGRTLKAIRRERGPLPPAEAMAFILGILPAFAYLHEQALVYCDFKPDNFMAEADDVKLIDMGAVRRIGDPHGDLYATIGYKAPEADDDPDIPSDLFTIGRTLAVLLQDFDNTGRYATSLPPPQELLFTLPEAMLQKAGIDPAGKLTLKRADGGPHPPWLNWRPASRSLSGTAPPGVTALDLRVEGVGGTLNFTVSLPLVQHESLYRFLLKATAADPDARFQSAEEMATQLQGVLRETVALDGPIPAQDSTLFLGLRAGSPGSPLNAAESWRVLPELRLDATDPAAAEIFAASTLPPAERITALATALRAKPLSAEALLRQADARIEAGQAEMDPVMALLDQALALNPRDWRPDWICGKFYLAQGRAAEAVECFDSVYGKIPGEAVPKLALALALEAAGRFDDATPFFERVSRSDPGLTAAGFGLARCRLARGDRSGAVAALIAIPETAAVSADAKLAAIRLLTEGTPQPAALAQAGTLLAMLGREDLARYEAEAAIALKTIALVETGTVLTERLGLGDASIRALRLRAEAALRRCARLSSDPSARIGFIDQANAARPQTLW